MTLLMRGNDALNVNPPPGASEILSQHGSDWLWAVTAVYIVAFLGILSLCFTARESDRVFHYLYTLALLVGSTTYFAQASDLGWSVVHQADHLGQGVSRQVFFAKYINWLVAFPSFALSLGLLSGTSWVTIILNIATSWFWVLTYLAAAYTTTDYKWGFFAFGTLAWVILTMSLVNECREAADLIGIGRDYIMLAGYLNVILLCYPIAFALTDGGNMLSPTSSAIFFGVLDVLSLPILSIAFVVLGRKWDYEKLNLAFSDYRRGRSGIVPVGKDATQVNGDITDS